MLAFTKMNGAGNDFVLIDNRSLSFALEPARIARLCDRHRGVGADGLIAAERFGARLLGLAETITFETLAGTLTAKLLGAQVQLAMSQPHSTATNASLEAASENLQVHFINTGVPHAVVFCEDLPGTDVRKLGSALRHHSHFSPKGTNANFATQHADGTLSVRTYERGVEDETLACGTGVVATALIHHLLHGASSPIAVAVKGGDTLQVSFIRTGELFQEVTLTGPADFVFEGTTEL